MARVARQLDLVVLDHVLFDDCVPVALELGLLQSHIVEVGLGNETIIAWDVGGCFGCAHCQLVVLVLRPLCLTVQFVAGVLSIRAERFLVFSVEVASLGAVRLTINAPLWPGGFGDWLAELLVVDLRVVRLPVGSAVAQILACLLQRGRHLSSLHRIVLSPSGVDEQLRLVIQLILD